MITDPLFYLAAIPAVLIVGISKGGFGGGLGLIAVPMMALVISPVQAAAIMLPILCIMDLFALW
ncbi:MAG: sulfite exporter TauE/SafE family protein, partial [Neptuniibacter sp.]